MKKKLLILSVFSLIFCSSINFTKAQSLDNENYKITLSDNNKTIVEKQNVSIKNNKNTPINLLPYKGYLALTTQTFPHCIKGLKIVKQTKTSCEQDISETKLKYHFSGNVYRNGDNFFIKISETTNPESFIINKKFTLKDSHINFGLAQYDVELSK